MNQLSKLIEKFQNAQKLKITFMKFSKVRNEGYMALGSKISKLKELTKIRIFYQWPLQIYQDQLNNLINFLKKLPKLEDFSIYSNGSSEQQNKEFMKSLEDISLKRFKFQINCQKLKAQDKLDEIICQIAEAKNIKNITINAFNRNLELSLVQRILDITNNSSSLDSFTFMLNLNQKISNQIHGLEQILELSQATKVFFSIQLGQVNNLQSIKNFLRNHSCLTGLELLQNDAYGLSNLLDENNFNLLAVLQKQEHIENFKLTSKKCSFQNYILLYQQLANMRSLKKACVIAQCQSGKYYYYFNKLEEGNFSLSDAIKEDKEISSIFNNSLSLEIFHKQEEYTFLASFLQLCQPTHIKLSINPTYSKNYQGFLIEKYISPLVNYNNKIKTLELLFEGLENQKDQVEENQKIKQDTQNQDNSNSQEVYLDFSILKRLLQKQNSIQNLKLNIDSDYFKMNQIIDLFDAILLYNQQIKPQKSISYQFIGQLNQFKMMQVYIYHPKIKKQPDSLWIKEKDSLYYTVISIPERVEGLNVNNLFQEILSKIFDKENNQLTKIKYFRKFYYDTDDISFWNAFKNNQKYLQQALSKLEIIYFPQDKYESCWISNKNFFRFNYLQNLIDLKTLKVDCPSICFEQQSEQNSQSQYQFLNKIKKLDISLIGKPNYDQQGKLLNDIIQNSLAVEKLKIKCQIFNLSEEEINKVLESLKLLVNLQVLDLSLALDEQISLQSIIGIQKKFQQICKNVILELQHQDTKFLLSQFENAWQMSLDLGFQYQNNYFFQMDGPLLLDQDPELSLCENMKQVIIKLKSEDDFKSFKYLIKYFENQPSQYQEVFCIIDNPSIQFFEETIRNTNDLKYNYFLNFSVLKVQKVINARTLYLKVLQQINNQNIIGLNFYFLNKACPIDYEIFLNLARKLKRLTNTFF
ncbi:hypothetical protein ABPG74_010178 [Tetrahymena malaccensis]